MSRYKAIKAEREFWGVTHLEVTFRKCMTETKRFDSEFSGAHGLSEYLEATQPPAWRRAAPSGAERWYGATVLTLCSTQRIKSYKVTFTVNAPRSRNKSESPRKKKPHRTFRGNNTHNYHSPGFKYFVVMKLRLCFRTFPRMDNCSGTYWHLW